MTTDVMTSDDSFFRDWGEALKKLSPVIMGYVPVGAAYGVLAQKAGLSVLDTVLMSIMVYAGSAQLIAVGMFAAGIGPLVIIATTFIVNLRHLLMSASLSPHARDWTKLQIFGFTFELTDETFALHTSRFAEGDFNLRQTFLINCTLQFIWVVSSFAGAVAGTGIPDVKPLALDYALPVMFIALLTGQIRNGLHVFVAAISGFCALFMIQAGADQWSVIIATLVGATVGAVFAPRMNVGGEK